MDGEPVVEGEEDVRPPGDPVREGRLEPPRVKGSVAAEEVVDLRRERGARPSWRSVVVDYPKRR
jgi:hypothetical protein